MVLEIYRGCQSEVQKQEDNHNVEAEDNNLPQEEEEYNLLREEKDNLPQEEEYSLLQEDKDNLPQEAEDPYTANQSKKGCRVVR